MTVYKLGPANGYQSVRLAGGDDSSFLFERFVGNNLAASWTPIPIRLLRESDTFESALPSDFPSFTAGPPLFSATAIEVLRDLLEPYGEILPTQSDDGEYFVYNVTTLIDALDVERSDVEYFRDGKRIMDVDRYEFIPERLVGVPIFKLPQFERSYVFVTDAFVQRVLDTELTGFLFRPVWTAQ